MAVTLDIIVNTQRQYSKTPIYQYFFVFDKHESAQFKEPFKIVDKLLRSTFSAISVSQ